MSQFPRIDNLPPYVFNSINKFKALPRARVSMVNQSVRFGLIENDNRTRQTLNYIK